MTAYVDTSVLVAYYVPEPLSDEAEEALCAERGPVISDLVEVEFHSALARKVRGRELSEVDATRIRSVFLSHLEEGLYQRWELERRVYRVAATWFTHLNLGLRTLDCLHLCLASQEDFKLVTADRRLAEVADYMSIENVFVTARDASAEA